MALRNSDLAETLEQIGDLLELTDANPFRVRAFRNAARTVRDEARELADLAAAGIELASLPGIGSDLAALLTELLASGRCELHDDLRSQVPAGILAILKLPGIGPKKVRMMWRELAITTMAQLQVAAAEQRLRALKGFGAKTEAKILAAIASAKDGERRFRRDQAAPRIADILALLQAAAGPHAQVAAAGSWRRGKESLGDLDFLVAVAGDTAPIMDAFVGGDDVHEVLAHGDSKSSVRLRNGLQADLRVVAPAAWGAALLYFTGSQAHNIALRSRAKDRGLKLNEYALVRDGVVIAAATESDVYAALDLPWIAPELREDRGEIGAAEKNALPQLITVQDWQGNLHAHTNWSDGRHPLAEIVAAAHQAGYAYWAVTDHSRHLTVANGLDAARLRHQMAEIEQLNAQYGDGFRILKGIEVDILEDGSLDLDDHVLADLDIVIASVHHMFGLDEAAQTARILKAMDNPHVHAIGHPTGRLIGKRPPYAVDVARVIEHAVATGVWLELNASPLRLDLGDHYLRLAAQRGAKITINTDAHRIRDFAWLEHGIAQARRGWLTAADVVNTRNVEGVLALRRG